MNKKLPFLDELLFATRDTYIPPTNNRNSSSYDMSDLSGYYNTRYLGSSYIFPKTIIFCLKCGNYKFSCNLIESNVKICDCKHIYPKNRIDWGLVSIKNTYLNLKLVHQELFQKFIKKDMKNITELVVALKTNTKIQWF